MVRIVISLPALLTLLFFGSVCESAPVPQHVDPDLTYTQMIQCYAQKIVDTLAIDDEAKILQVWNLISVQYRSLSILHDAHDVVWNFGANTKYLKSIFQAGDYPDPVFNMTKCLYKYIMQNHE